MAGNAEHRDGWHASRWRIIAWTSAGLILLLPLVAMQFTDEVNWEVADFAFAGILLISAGITCELVVRKTGNIAYRYAVGLALAAAVLLFWVNGAVGIIGSENNDANLLYVGVFAVGIIGALIARFEPQGMARALFATAVAQVLVAVIALVSGWGITGPVWPGDVLGLTVFFTTLWVGSALMFRNAARG